MPSRRDITTGVALLWGQRRPMKALRVGPDGKVTLPAALRKMTGVEAGERVVAVPSGRSIILTPLEPVDALRGIARGADPEGYRERSVDGRRR